MTDKIPDNIKKILLELKKELSLLFENRLMDVILFGSYAQGDFEEGSDIDVLIIIRDMVDWSKEYKKSFDKIWELSLKYDVVISVVFANDQEYQNTKLPLYIKRVSSNFKKS